MTNEPMRRNGQACSKCGKYLGMATGKQRTCKKCKISKITQKKMEFILADENQSITGFVVTNKDGAVTIINQNAVRRFQSHEDYMAMMNPKTDENMKGSE